MENNARKLGLQINQEKIKYMIVERKKFLKQNNTGVLKININICIRNLDFNKER